MFYLFLRHDAFSFVLSADELSAGLFFLARLRARKYLFMANAVRPPVDTVPTATIAAVAIQNGHMCASFCYRDDCLLPYPSSGANGFGLLADAIQYVCPALSHPGFVLIGNESKCCVAEGDQGSALFFAQAILQIVEYRRRHEEWPGKFEQRWPLNGLYSCP